MPHRPASRDDDRVATEMFGMLAANMRLGVPANLVAAPIFYAALSMQGPVPGFVAWLLVLLLLVLLYFAWVRPWQRRALAARRLKALSRGLVAYSLVFGSLWGLATMLWFSPDPWRQVVLIVALMALAVTGCFATASHMPSAWALCLPMALGLLLSAANHGTPLTLLMAPTALLVVGVLLY